MKETEEECCLIVRRNIQCVQYSEASLVYIRYGKKNEWRTHEHWFQRVKIYFKESNSIWFYKQSRIFGQRLKQRHLTPSFQPAQYKRRQENQKGNLHSRDMLEWKQNCMGRGKEKYTQKGTEKGRTRTLRASN